MDVEDGAASSKPPSSEPAQVSDHSTESHATVVNVPKAPKEPTPQEREEHNLTHLPYRSWCRHCVRGRGKSEAHRELEAEKQHSVPHVSFDYCFLGQNEEKCSPVLVTRDHSTRFAFSQVVPCKGTGHNYCSVQTLSNIEQLGHSKIV